MIPSVYILGSCLMYSFSFSTSLALSVTSVRYPLFLISFSTLLARLEKKELFNVGTIIPIHLFISVIISSPSFALECASYPNRTLPF